MPIIMGIDPGLAHAGWGIVSHDGLRSRHVAHGVLNTDAKLPPALRLQSLFNELNTVIQTYKPDCAGIETLYFARNVTSALPVAQARGVLLLALAENSVPVAEYTPLQIKQAVVGNGRAEKSQVQMMTALLLKLAKPPRPDHAADALAAAICHAHTGGLS